ncbi:SCO6745 family protein [Streptomyces sp. NRRL F-5053]|uniref:SCO6745 family protein n=1 Tax=Streptomyces sp. NRRL F-5053 TaxID=1463854 RepID=UPI0004CBCA76|nr:hypothetical protein [Streptomyces sp. NRRL F-5053]
MADFPSLARQMWHRMEPVYASLYFVPQAAEKVAALGYDPDSPAQKSLALRGAPLGAVPAELLTAVFHSFSPRLVADHVPGIWDTATPAAVLDTRIRAADTALRTLLGDRLTEPSLAEAAELARTAAQEAAARLPGRPLAAANAALPWPEEPHLVLWQAANILREHRGDGHVAALTAAGLDGCEALVSFAAIGAAPVETFASRGWSAQEWAAARERLADRGLVEPDGTATEQGHRLREDVERTTDELAAAPYEVLGEDGCARLGELTTPLIEAVVTSGLLPEENTLGILRVPAPAPR